MKSTVHTATQLAERRAAHGALGPTTDQIRAIVEAEPLFEELPVPARDEPDEHGHEHHHEHHVTMHATGKRHVLHDVLDLVGLLLVGVAAWLLWPASLGGSTHVIVVQGHSMEPVFHLGDAIVVKDNDDPQIGDIIVYRVPKGSLGEGKMIVHRIVAVRLDGTFETKGDNRDLPDPFHVAKHDIVGTPAWTLPHVGRMIGLASSPLVIGVAIGLVVLLLLLPNGKDEEERSDAEPSTERRRRRRGRVTDAAADTAPVEAVGG